MIYRLWVAGPDDNNLKGIWVEETVQFDKFNSDPKYNKIYSTAFYKPARDCCLKHWELDNSASSIELDYGPLIPAHSRMIVCKNCGNKRCPKATNCDLECTNSNELGQVSSSYSNN